MTFGEGMYMERIWEYTYRKLLPLFSFVSFFHLILQQAALYNIADRIIETYESKKNTSEGGGQTNRRRLIMNLTSIFQIFTIETVWNDTGIKHFQKPSILKNFTYIFNPIDAHNAATGEPASRTCVTVRIISDDNQTS